MTRSQGPGRAEKMAGRGGRGEEVGIWRARVSVHYPRPKYGYKRIVCAYARCISGVLARVFHPESSNLRLEPEGGRKDG